MSYYELINPSDQYTLRAANIKTAVTAALLLGSGRYGLADVNGAEVMPLFIGGGLDEWLYERYRCTVSELVDRADKAALAECLDSVAICSLKDRRLWDMAVEAMDDPSKRAAWLAEWHDVHRSSMNDIGGRAKAYAKRARELAVEKPVTP